MKRLSVILPTHNPHAGRLARALGGLRTQTLPCSDWELIVVDNASRAPLTAASLQLDWHPNARVVREPAMGLTNARLCGVGAALGEVLVFVDDDNVLAPNYLAATLEIFSRWPQAGIVGGKAIGEFEISPADWQREFLELIAVRDLGAEEQFSGPIAASGSAGKQYPRCAPIGAGMALRLPVAVSWANELRADATRRRFDRTGADLTSGGDNDIVMTALEHGWSVGYCPQLELSHLIPAGRLAPGYLARINRAMQRSWVRILALHEACPWPPIAAWTVPLRQMKAWFVHRAWSSPAAHIRWQGACGHFEGRVRAATMAERP